MYNLCCSTRISVSLTHYTFLKKGDGGANTCDRAEVCRGHPGVRVPDPVGWHLVQEGQTGQTSSGTDGGSNWSNRLVATRLHLVARTPFTSFLLLYYSHA